MLKSIVNQSSTMIDNIMTNNTMTTMTNNTMTTMTDNTMTDNTIKEMPSYDRAIRNRTTNILRRANRYGVLKDSDNDNEVNVRE